MSLHIIDAGIQTLIEDAGRPGYAAVGVSRSGAFDRASMRRTNRALGNAPEEAVLEILFGGLRLTADSDHLICIGGAVGPADIDGAPVHHEWPVPIIAGQTLSLGAPVIGMRTYVGVQGGIDTPSVLHSRSCDTMSGIGPPPLTKGSRLDVGVARGGVVASEPDFRLSSGDLTLAVTIGPHLDWFDPDALTSLLHSRWIVSPDSNRLGVRLDGPSLDRKRHGELPPVPCIRGSIQVASGGQPIAFGPDHPVTGGYPVIAVINDADTDLLGQVRPGQGVRFSR